MPPKKTAKENGASATAAAGAKPARKAPAKKAIPRNNVAKPNEKVPESSRKHRSTVKSGAESQSEADSTTTRVRTRGERKPYTRLTDDLIDNIIDLLHTNSLADICRLPGMPERTTFMRRLAADADLQKRYSAAIEVRADVLVDEIIQIADDTSQDTVMTENGPKANSEWIQRSRLRVDARKWAAAKMAPKKYGDKLDMNHGVQPGNPLASLLAKVAGTALPIASNLPDDSED